MFYIKRKPIYYAGVHARHKFLRTIQCHGPHDAQQICAKNIMCDTMVVIDIYQYDTVKVRCTIRCRETFFTCQDLPNDATVLRDAIRHVIQ
jgi:predicted metal-binding membrane protein